MSDKKMMNDLVLAYRTEMDGYNFYSAAAAVATEDKGRLVFFNLAKDELEHLRVLSRIADSVKAGSGWLTYEDALRQGASITAQGLPIYPERSALIKSLEKNPTDLNAVMIGIESEESAIEFYSMMLKAATGPVEKVLLTKILEMEKGHLKVLRWESESINKTGFWCGEMEYSVEKESE